MSKYKLPFLLATNGQNANVQIDVPKFFFHFRYFRSWVRFPISGIGHVWNIATCCKMFAQKYQDQFCSRSQMNHLRIFMPFTAAVTVDQARRGIMLQFILIDNAALLSSVICRFRGYHKKLFLLLQSLQLTHCSTAVNAFIVFVSSVRTFMAS